MYMIFYLFIHMSCYNAVCGCYIKRTWSPSYGVNCTRTT